MEHSFNYYVLKHTCDIQDKQQFIKDEYKKQLVVNQDTLLNFQFEEFGISTKIQKIFYFVYPNHKQSDDSEKNKEIIKEMQNFIAFTSLLTKYIKIFGSCSLFIFDNQNYTSDIQYIPELYYHIGLLSIHQDISTQIFYEYNLELYQQIREANSIVFYLNTQFSLKVEHDQLLYQKSKENNFTPQTQENINFVLLQYQTLLPAKFSADTEKDKIQIQKNKEFHNFSFFQAFVAQQLVSQQKVAQQKKLKERIQRILLHSEHFYNKMETPEQHSADPNFLQIPFFLYFVFQKQEQLDQQKYQHLVQLLVDCSYLHKIIHFLLSVYVNESDNLSNNLLLHSSRSGKSTVCKALYYFYMLLQDTEQVIQYTPFYFLCINNRQENQPSYSSYTMNNMFNGLFPYKIQLTDANLFTLKEFQDYIKDNKNQKVEQTIQELLNIVDANLNQFSALDQYTLDLYQEISAKYIDLQKIKQLEFQTFNIQRVQFNDQITQTNVTLNFQEFISKVNIDWFNIQVDEKDEKVFQTVKINELKNLKPLFLFDEVLQRHKNIFLEHNKVNNLLIQILNTIIENEEPDKPIKINKQKHPDIAKTLELLHKKEQDDNKELEITVGQMLLLCCPMSYYLRKNYRYNDNKINLTKEFFKKESLNIKEMVSVRNFETIFIRDFQLNFKYFIKNNTIIENQDYLFFLKKGVEVQEQNKKSSDIVKNIKDKLESSDETRSSTSQVFSFFAGTDFSIHNMINFGSITKTSQSSRDDYPLVHLTYQGQAQFHPKFLDKRYYIDLQTYLDPDSSDLSVRAQINKFDDINQLFQFISMNSQDGKSFTQLLSPVLQPQVIIHLKDIQFDNSNVSTIQINSYKIYIRLIYDLFNQPLQIFNQGEKICMQTNINNCQPLDAKDFSQYFYVNSQSLFNIKDNLQVQCDLYSKVTNYLKTSLEEPQIQQLVTDLKIHFQKSEIYEFLNILCFISSLLQQDGLINENIEKIIKKIDNTEVLNREQYFMNSRFQNDEIITNVLEELYLNFGEQLKSCNIQFIHPLISKDYNLDCLSGDQIKMQQKFIENQLTFIDDIYNFQSTKNPTLFIMFIDSKKLFQYIQLRNIASLSNNIDYQTFKQSDFLLKFCNFNQTQNQFSSTLQEGQFFLLEYGPHSYREILLKSDIITKKIAVVSISNQTDQVNSFWLLSSDKLKSSLKKMIVQNNYNQLNYQQSEIIDIVRINFIKLLKAKSNVINQYKTVINIIQSFNLQIIYKLKEYSSFQKLNNIIIQQHSYYVRVFNQFHQQVESFNINGTQFSSLFQYMLDNNYLLLSFEEKKIEFLNIQPTTLILQNWLNKQLKTLIIQEQQYLLLFQIFVTTCFGGRQQNLRFSLELDIQLFFVQYKSINKQIFCIRSLCEQYPKKQLQCQILNNFNVDYTQLGEAETILSYLVQNKCILVNSTQTNDNIILQLIKLNPSDQVLNVEKLFQQEILYFNFDQKIILWSNQQISHVNSNFIMLNSYLKKFQKFDFSEINNQETEAQMFYTHETADDQIKTILINCQLAKKIIFKDFMSGDQKHIESLYNKPYDNYTSFLTFLQNFIIIGWIFNPRDLEKIITILITEIEPSETPLKTIQQWITAQTLTQQQNILVSNYLNKFSSIQLDEQIAAFANIHLFQDQITVEEQIKFTIKDAILVKNKFIQIDLFDLNTKQQIEDKSIKLQSNKLKVDDLLTYLNNYVLFNFTFSSNQIIFKVIKVNDLKVEESISLVTLQNWFIKYKPYSSPEIKTYLENSNYDSFFKKITKAANKLDKEFSTQEEQIQFMITKARVANYLNNPLKLTEQIARKANLKLYTDFETVEKQIQFIIDSVIEQANEEQDSSFSWLKEGNISIELYSLEKQEEVYGKQIFAMPQDLTVIDMLIFLDTHVVVNYDFDYNRLLLHVISSAVTPLEIINLWKRKVTAEDVLVKNYIQKLEQFIFNDEIAAEAELNLFCPKLSVRQQIYNIFKPAIYQAKQDGGGIKCIFFNLKDQEIEKQDDVEIILTIEIDKFLADNVLEQLGSRLILASEYENNCLILSVVKSDMCEYCRNIDKACLVTCLDCDKKFCNDVDNLSPNSHVLRHINKYEHFMFQLFDGQQKEIDQSQLISIYNQQPKESQEVIKSIKLQEILNWFQNYKRPNTAEVENYIEKFNFVNWTNKITRNSDVKLFYHINTVEQQIHQIFGSICQKQEDQEKLIKIKFLNLNTNKILEQNEKMIKKGEFTHIFLLNSLDNMVILASEYFPIKVYNKSDKIEQINVETVILSVVKSFIKIQHWLENYPVNNLEEPEKIYINNFKRLNMEEIVDIANFDLFVSDMTIKMQIEHIFKTPLLIAQQNKGSISVKFFNLKTQQIEKQKGSDVFKVIQQQNNLADSVFELLGRRLILASEYENNIVTLIVVKSDMCQYCFNIDKACLVTCLNCGEKLCNDQHVYKHTFEFRHANYRLHDGTIQNLTNFSIISSWISDYNTTYPEPYSQPVKNYVKNFKSFNLVEIADCADSANLELFAHEMSVKEQLLTIFSNALKAGYPIKIQLRNLRSNVDGKYLVIKAKLSGSTVLNFLGSNVILAQEWLEQDNVVILKVIIPVVCQYCENADRNCLIRCVDCHEYLCNNKDQNASFSHIVRHMEELQHFKYIFNDGTPIQCSKCLEQDITQLYKDQKSSIVCNECGPESYDEQKIVSKRKIINLNLNTKVLNVKDSEFE